MRIEEQSWQGRINYRSFGMLGQLSSEIWTLYLCFHGSNRTFEHKGKSSICLLSPVWILRISNKEMVFYGKILSEIISSSQSLIVLTWPNQTNTKDIMFNWSLFLMHSMKINGFTLSCPLRAGSRLQSMLLPGWSAMMQSKILSHCENPHSQVSFSSSWGTKLRTSTWRLSMTSFFSFPPFFWSAIT